MQVEDLGSVERDAVVMTHRGGGSTGLWAESAIYDCLVDAGGGPGLGGA